MKFLFVILIILCFMLMANEADKYFPIANISGVILFLILVIGGKKLWIKE